MIYIKKIIKKRTIVLFHLLTGILSYVTKPKKASNETQLYLCTCKWNASNMEENVPCNDTILMYYSSKAIYISDPEKNATGSYECELVENDVLKKNTTSSHKELMSKCLSYHNIS